MSREELNAVAQIYNVTPERLIDSMKEELLTGRPRISFLGVVYTWHELKKIYDDIKLTEVK